MRRINTRDGRSGHASAKFFLPKFLMEQILLQFCLSFFLCNVKVKFSHSRYRALGQTWSRCTGSQPAGDLLSHLPAVGCHYFPPGLRITFVSVHHVAPPPTEVTHLITAYINYTYRPRWNERLSWPGWLTYDGPLTHISGHPSATDWAQATGHGMLAGERPTFYR